MMKPKIFHLGLCVPPQNSPINAMQKAFMDNSSAYAELSSGHPNVNEEALRICADFRPDLVFMQIQAAGIIHPETVAKMRMMGAFVLNWTGDVRSPLPVWFKQLGADLTCFSNMPDVLEMRGDGLKADYLEIGFDENIYTNEGKKNGCEPIVFFGNSYGRSMFPESAFRSDMVSYMKANFAGRFGVYGTGWQMASGNYGHSQPEEAAAYRASLIAINASHFCIEKYSSDRLFRILGTGSPICLCKYYPGMEQDFVDGIHLRVWRTLEELKALCYYYMDPENESERKQIAEAGMKLARNKFTFDEMAKNAIKLYEKNKV
jgi:spore maturation protein CgeB